jgi:hypothetical protein
MNSQETETLFNLPCRAPIIHHERLVTARPATDTKQLPDMKRKKNMPQGINTSSC